MNRKDLLKLVNKYKGNIKLILNKTKYGPKNTKIRFRKYFENGKKHLKTINRHKMLVMKECFSVGLIWQGLLHDLSKYSPREFYAGVLYYTDGKNSPNSNERLLVGQSKAWLRHKGRNKHHFEYWLDYCGKPTTCITGMKMPDRYIVEMFMDRVAACKVYQGENYTNKSSLDYYENSIVSKYMHEYTNNVLYHLLVMLATDGEKKTFSYIRKNVLFGYKWNKMK